MSRVGKAPVVLPKGVEFSFNDSLLAIKGPNGELKQSIDPDFKIEQEDGSLVVKRPTEQKRHKALHGLYRALIANMVTGVTEGYTVKLEMVGVGYRAEIRGAIMELSLGFSHPVFFGLPPEVKAETEAVKGKAPLLILKSADKQLLGQVVSKLRSLRPPEPYKGKGIRFQGERVRRKAGKAAAKK